MKVKRRIVGVSPMKTMKRNDVDPLLNVSRSCPLCRENVTGGEREMEMITGQEGEYKEERVGRRGEGKRRWRDEPESIKR